MCLKHFYFIFFIFFFIFFLNNKKIEFFLFTDKLMLEDTPTISLGVTGICENKGAYIKTTNSR